MVRFDANKFLSNLTCYAEQSSEFLPFNAKKQIVPVYIQPYTNCWLRFISLLCNSIQLSYFIEQKKNNLQKLSSELFHQTTRKYADFGTQ